VIKSNRFIVPISLAKVVDAAAVRQDVRQLINLADHASSVRCLDIVSQCANKLQDFSLPAGVAEFYNAITLPGEIAERMLLKIADCAPDRYKARAITNLARLHSQRGDFTEGVRLYQEARRVAFDPFVDVLARRMTAVTLSVNGDHHHAVAVLEKNMRAAREATRNTLALFLDYLNSYAVELAAVKRFDEAERVSRFVVASPASIAYPEWRETLAEIEGMRSQASRRRAAMIAVSEFRNSQSEIRNVVHLASRASFVNVESEIREAQSPARILLFSTTPMANKAEDPAPTPDTPHSLREQQLDLLRDLLDADPDEATIQRIRGLLKAKEEQRREIDKVLKRG
jgi:tetratricopeptide (TPR) repeat protein